MSKKDFFSKVFQKRFNNANKIRIKFPSPGSSLKINSSRPTPESTIITLIWKLTLWHLIKLSTSSPINFIVLFPARQESGPRKWNKEGSADEIYMADGIGFKTRESKQEQIKYREKLISNAYSTHLVSKELQRLQRFEFYYNKYLICHYQGAVSPPPTSSALAK